MQAGNPGRSKTLSVLAALFISAYFFVFTFDTLNAYFTFDDGMNLVALHRLWDVPFRSNVIDVLKVFTPAYRPLGALFYRPLYGAFGFNPLPFRMVCYGLMILNIVLAYRFARVLNASPEASAFSTLLFAYNGSMSDLYYNSGTIYDLLCFPLYIGAVLVYVRQRSRDLPLSFGTMVLVSLLFLAALDAKELAVTLPAALLAYELIYHPADFKSRQVVLRTGAFIGMLFAASALFLKVKLSEMSANALYHPHVDVPYILTGIGHYVEQLFYLQPESFGPVKVGTCIVALLAAAAARSCRTIAFGGLFFVIGLIPLSVIVYRNGYAAYVAYPGITLAIGVAAAGARAALIRISGRKQLETAAAVILFLSVAAISIKSFAHTRKVAMANALWDEQRRIDLLGALKRSIPEFPPNARILLIDDLWGPDWGPMFLTKLMYRDPTLWMDRLKDGNQTEPRDTYDLVISYKEPILVTRSPRFLGIHKTWDILWFPYRRGKLTLAAPDDARSIRNIRFSPATAAPGQTAMMSVPGLSNVRIDAVCRTVTGGATNSRLAPGWCTLDASGACSISIPPAAPGAMLAIDWIRPSNGRWIFTRGSIVLR